MKNIRNGDAVYLSLYGTYRKAKVVGIFPGYLLIETAAINSPSGRVPRVLRRRVTYQMVDELPRKPVAAFA